MIISKCEFSPPVREGTQANVLVILDGILVLSDISIVRERNPVMRKYCLSILLPSGTFFTDGYSEELFQNEILDRYENWSEGQRHLQDRDDEFCMI